MQILIRKLSGRLYGRESFVTQWRAARLQDFIRLVRPPKNARIVDLGGTEYFWNLIDHEFDLTLVNIDQPDNADTQRFKHVTADATDLSDVLSDNSFDVVFCNSVIEHVGAEDKQLGLAKEVRRLAKAYWVQTPSDKFPVEVHTGVPFYWHLPLGFRERLLTGWERKLPAWTSFIRETRVLTKDRMSELFPDGEIYIEQKFMFEKSYAFYKPYSHR